MRNNMWTGSMPALVTPMHEDGNIDYKTLDRLIEWHCEYSDALVILGTTGEAPTILLSEKVNIVQRVIDVSSGKIPIIVGTGSNSTQGTVELTRLMSKQAIDGCLVVTPYYNKPTQAGLHEHFKTIAESTDLPIILYNVPGRTGCDLLPETAIQLAKINNIVAIKEATGDLARVGMLKEALTVYSGEDGLALKMMLDGAKGVISVTANVVPAQMAQMCQYALQGQAEPAQAINAKLEMLHEALFLESNPIPVKWLLNDMKKIGSGIRLPLTPLDEKFHLKLRNALSAVAS